MMSTSNAGRDNREPDNQEGREQPAPESGKREDRSRYNLEKDSVEDLANEPMREEGEDEPED